MTNPRIWHAAAAAAVLAATFLSAGCGPQQAEEPAATTSSAPTTSSTPADSSAVTATTPSEPAASTASPATGGTTPTAAGKSGKVVTTASGLKYEDVKIGTGAAPKAGQYVSVHYTGTLSDGTKFGSSRDRGQPIEFPLGQGRVIPGWDEGIASMKVGGRRKLTIPAKLAYGDNPPPGAPIPPGATLLFDVELVGASDSPTQQGGF